MTVARLLRHVEQAGGRLELRGGRVVCVGWRGLDAATRALVTAMRAQVRAVLGGDSGAPEPERQAVQPARRVVGQVAERIGGRLVWRPLFADTLQPLNPSGVPMTTPLMGLAAMVPRVVRERAPAHQPAAWPARRRAPKLRA